MRKVRSVHASGRQPPRRWIALGALALAFGLCGCEVEFSGFDDILDPGPSFVSFPGRRLASGRLQSPSVESTAVTEPHVIAFDVSDGPRLVIASFDEAGSCRTGRANSYQRFQFPASSDFELVVPYVEQRGDATRLHFVDASCRDLVEPIQDAGLPVSPHRFFRDPPRYLVRAGDRVLFVDPWNGRISSVATGVESLSVTDNHLWTLEDGEVIVRKRDGEIIRRLGSSVTELSTSVLRGRGAYVDDGALYWVDPEKDAEPVFVEDGACRVGFPAAWAGRGLAYDSPCDERRLVLFEIDRPARAGFERVDERYALDENVIAGPAIRDVGETFVFYVTSEDPEASLGTLWGTKLGEPPERIGESAELDGVAQTRRGKWQIIVNVSSETGAGRLVEWEPGSDPMPVLDAVARYDPPFAVANFNGEVGDAVWLGLSGSRRKIASGVPRNGIQSTIVGFSIVADFDGASGTLLAAPEDDEFAFEEIARRVQPSSIGFIGGIDAVGYLRQYDPDKEAGLLGVRVLDTADTFEIDIVADDWTVTERPDPGVLYTVPTGSTRGLWFARLK